MAAIVLDTSVAVAFMNRSDEHHEVVTAWLGTTTESLVTSPLVLAEVDHLVATRGGPAGRAAWHRDLADGAYDVEWWPGAEAEAATVADRYRHLRLGLTDASVVVLASRVSSIRIATLDERHFRAVAPLGDAPAFELLPADAP